MTSAVRKLRAKLDALRAFRATESLERVLLNQGKLWTAMMDLRPAATLQQSEFRVFSQWGEDGVIQRLLRLVPIAHRTFIEFGVEDFSESNCRFLMMNDNWRGHVIDGNAANIASIKNSYYYWRHELTADAAFITPDTIDALLAKSGFDPDLGLLSIDIDGVDYWVLSAITRYRPRIVVAEYNAVFGADRAITVPLDPAFRRATAHSSMLYFGASLGALRHWAATAGYQLVGTTSTGSNAFFVRGDLMTDELRALAADAGFTPSRVREARDASGALTMAAGEERLSLIRGLPVVDVVTGAIEPL